MTPHRRIFTILSIALLAAAPLAAQQGGITTFSGKGKVTEALDTDKGAIFDIGGGVTMFFPKGLPVGHSRLVTLKKGKKRPAKGQIHPKFVAHGGPLEFSGALNAPDRPIELALRMKREPVKKGRRFVLAMEVGGFCEAHNKKYKLKSGLCSEWQINETRYDHGGKRVVAELGSTGGMRMQFGYIPIETPDEE